jgi:anthranilate synthase/aminodeoxychorismate synthase-like glutamine amidotransferase
MILLIDHYDSFVYNLARYFEQLGHAVQVLRDDAVPPDAIEDLDPLAIILSPGPCSPREAGNSIAIVCEYYRQIPMLGVCLGHQIIAAAFGAAIERAAIPMHGRSSPVRHGGVGLFRDLPNPLTVGRYHSLVVDESSLCDDLVVTARTDDGTVMALEHSRHPIYGVQFHPESVLTEGGYTLLTNFLRLAGLQVASQDEPPIVREPAKRPPSTAVPVVPIPY